MITATDNLRRMLDDRGVEWKEEGPNKTKWSHHGVEYVAYNAWPRNGGAKRLILCANLTPEQVVAEALGSEQRSDPVWEQWSEGLRHDEVKTIEDAVEQLMYEVIKFGGDMRPNGNTCGCVDEGEVVTLGFINSWVEKFEAMLGTGMCKVESSVAIEFNTLIHPDYYEFEMSCGYRFGWTDKEPPDYCPGCGRKVHDGS